MRLRAVLIAAAAATAWSGVALAGGDAETGRIKAAACAACHGAGGAQPISNYPVIAGQHEDYLLHTMRAYVSGVRSNAVMSAQLAPLSDEDLRDLAAYFAAQPAQLR